MVLMLLPSYPGIYLLITVHCCPIGHGVCNPPNCVCNNDYTGIACDCTRDQSTCRGCLDDVCLSVFCCHMLVYRSSRVTKYNRRVLCNRLTYPSLPPSLPPSLSLSPSLPLSLSRIRLCVLVKVHVSVGCVCATTTVNVVASSVMNVW